jgi:coenzyme F420-reducing hydrogenase delta subunit
MSEQFEPEVVAFSCHYCAYAAADLAGVMRLSYPPNVKIIKLPCTGRLDPLYVLQAFERGADGVFVAGCLEGNCHYLSGNTSAKRRIGFLKKVLDQVGLGAERLEMYHMSSAQGTRFAEVATEFTERILKLGPTPVRRGAAEAVGIGGAGR